MESLSTELSQIEVPTKMMQLDLDTEIEFHEEQKFLKIMMLADVSPQNITESLDLDNNKDQVFKAGQGSGMSGSFFFFSKDGKFLIKTI